MEENKQDLMRIIQVKFPRLSKGQKLIAEFILKHYDKAAFMTAAKLGTSVGVSESTVVRFANELGFTGYPKLQKALQELIKNKLTTVQRIELSNDYVSEEFLGFYLNLILDNVNIIAYGISDIFEQMINVSENDLVIGIGFPRYAARTIEALTFAQNRGAKVVAITDSLLSPLAAKADYTLIAQSNMASFVDSLVAPLSVINALIIAVGLREKDKISSTFSTLEDIWQEYEVYSYRDNKDKKY